jgi:hypothetical protein
VSRAGGSPTPNAGTDTIASADTPRAALVALALFAALVLGGGEDRG